MGSSGFAWFFEGSGRPFVRRARELAAPAGGHAIVEVIGCGLCHTDLGYARGEVPTRNSPMMLSSMQASSRRGRFARSQNR